MAVLRRAKCLNLCVIFSCNTVREKSYLWRKTLVRGLSTQNDSFKFSDLEIMYAKQSQKKTKPDPNLLVFGKHFSDHMFEVEWQQSKGWGKPRICPIHDFILHPGSKVLHYAQELFEGLKAFKGSDGTVRLFRPDQNIKRMLTTAERANLPLFDGEEFLKCLKKLVMIDQDWIPNLNFSSLYVRPTFIGTEPSLGVASSNVAHLYIITGPVGPYFSTGIKPVSLLADPKYIRSWPGGVGDKKMGSNYGPTIYVQKLAEKQNLQQVLWLFGEDHQLTEVGTMNIFVFLVNEKGEKELATPPLDGTILPGVVRQSVLDLAREWNEFKVSERSVTMKEVQRALAENRLLEIFGSGTACSICPVSSINYQSQHLSIPTMDQDNPLNIRLMNTLNDIQYGKIPHKWSVSLE